ncbi:MAG TPA: hypothetical protein VGJ63_11420, partial [Micromonosporaceae bacterium]
MHRPDGDLVHPRSLHGEERERLGGVAELRWGAGVVAHRVPARRPVPVPDQAAREWVVEGLDAVQVVHFAFEAAGG